MSQSSRFAGFIIDCQTDDLEAAGRFWSEAQAMPLKATQQDDKYMELETGDLGIYIEVQQVRHDSRVHLDLKAHDVEAEACRLEALGAKRVERFPNWWVMEAPTGQRFCIVQIHGTQDAS